MIYLQIKSGQKLHLAYEAGEGPNDKTLVMAGHISPPICGRGFDKKTRGYKMTINVSLGYACKNCLRVYAQRYGAKP